MGNKKRKQRLPRGARRGPGRPRLEHPSKLPSTLYSEFFWKRFVPLTNNFLQSVCESSFMFFLKSHNRHRCIEIIFLFQVVKVKGVEYRFPMVLRKMTSEIKNWKARQSQRKTIRYLSNIN